MTDGLVKASRAFRLVCAWIMQVSLVVQTVCLSGCLSAAAAELSLSMRLASASPRAEDP